MDSLQGVVPRASRIASGSVVTVVFTDGNLPGLTLTPSSITVTPGSPAVYSADVTMGGTAGACNVTVSVLGPLPPGAVGYSGAPRRRRTTPGQTSRPRPRPSWFTIRTAGS